MISSKENEEILQVIENDNVESFIDYCNKYPNWKEYYLNDKDMYLPHYAACSLHSFKLDFKARYVLKEMFKLSIDINIRNKRNETILHISLEKGLCDVVKLVLASEQAEYYNDIEGNNEIHKCLSHSCLVCLKLLLKVRIDWLQPNKMKNNIFHQAVLMKNYESFKLLLKYFNPEFIANGMNGNNIVHMCAINGNQKILNEVINLKIADINGVNDQNERAITLAIINKNYEIIDLLLTAHCLITADNLKTALEVYQKINSEYENQKKSRTFIHKKSGSNEIFDYRKSLQNFNNKKQPESFINVPNKHKRQESDTLCLPIMKKVSNIFNPKNPEDEKNSSTFSYSKNALKKNANSSMQNLHNTASVLPQYIQMSSMVNTFPKDKKISSPNKFTLNLKTNYLLNFITVDPSDIELGEKIYDADICEVYIGKYLTLPVAIKRYSITRLTEENLIDFTNEINILMCLRHPNIVTFIGKCIENNHYLILTEYMERRSLKYVLENKNISLSKSNLLSMALDISRAVYYLHTRNPPVFHRDLKSSNCLVDEYFRLKLCDFGISKVFESLPGMKTKSISTSFWMAPEYINERVFTDKSDVYSFGILFWEIMTRDTKPFKNIDNNAFLFGDEALMKKRPEIPSDFDPQVVDLIKQCWEGDPNKRPSIGIVVREIEKLLDRFSKENIINK